ncbi:MAG: FAD-binding oxidoreductase, partial [Proteobacteria bacterium]|nr:FAD-binding oxidoreductase [Pseudomonadota bacterium]
MKDKTINLLEKRFDRKDFFITSIPEKYFYDESTIYYGKPLAVFLPDNCEKVVDFIRFAKEENIKITPRGAGTGVCGGAVTTEKGVVISLERMDKIIEIDEVNLSATVEAGVINGILKEELKKNGYYYPPDPQSFESSSIGGNIATNAGGPSAIKYGTTKDYVMSLSVVTGAGKILNTGGNVYKYSSGYNLNELFIGSEGTLGIILRATLNFIRLPERKIFFLVPFKGIEDVMIFFRESIKGHLNFAALEFIDESAKNLV